MELFYTAGLVAFISALVTVTRTNAMHALLYLALFTISLATLFYSLGAPFAAVLQIVVYAGAIIVVFVFAVMMLDLGRAAYEIEKRKMGAAVWIVPFILAAILLGQFIFTAGTATHVMSSEVIGPHEVGVNLFTTYLVGVEIASILLLAALVAAVHLGWDPKKEREAENGNSSK